MVRSRDYTSQYEGSCVATLGEDTDTTRFRNFSKNAIQGPTTRKTTAKTTKPTTPEKKKTTIFASVKNLIRLFLTGLIFSRNVCNSRDWNRKKMKSASRDGLRFLCISIIV
jgi:hypothetical protein